MGLQVDIKIEYPGFALDVSFSEDSKRIGIFGPSGSGKSLTLKAIAGIVRPDAGRIVLDDRVLYDSSNRVDIKPQKRNVGYLFQNYALFPKMSVEENIAAGLKEKDRNLRREKVKDVIDRFGLSGLEKRLPSELSGGQQQRVALARIMVYEPDLILLDEPFSALDEYLRDRIREEMAEFLSSYPGKIIIVSHSREDINLLSDRLLTIDGGRITGQGDAEDIFKASR